jgi:protein-S-isoprenylcysteine O-methyltransferase Ste14
MKRMLIRTLFAIILSLFTIYLISLEFTPRLVFALLIGLPSFALTILSRRQIGKSFSVMPEAKALVQTGLYSKFQHPMYIFLDLFLLSVIIIIDLKILLIPWGIIVMMQVLQANKEESVLEKAFGSEYQKYAARKWF